MSRRLVTRDAESICGQKRANGQVSDFFIKSGLDLISPNLSGLP